MARFRCSIWCGYLTDYLVTNPELKGLPASRSFTEEVSELMGKKAIGQQQIT